MAIDNRVLQLVQAGVPYEQARQLVASGQVDPGAVSGLSGMLSGASNGLGNLWSYLTSPLNATPSDPGAQYALNRMKQPTPFEALAQGPIQPVVNDIQNTQAAEAAAGSPPGGQTGGQSPNTGSGSTGNGTPPMRDNSTADYTGRTKPGTQAAQESSPGDDNNTKGPKQPPSGGGTDGGAPSQATSPAQTLDNGATAPQGAIDESRFGLADSSPAAWGRRAFLNSQLDNGTDLLTSPMANSPWYSFLRNRYGDQASANATFEALNTGLDASQGSVDWARQNLGLDKLAAGGGAPAGGSAIDQLKSLGGNLTRAMSGDVSGFSTPQAQRLQTFGADNQGQEAVILQALRSGTGGWGLQSLQGRLNNLQQQAYDNPSAFSSPGSFYQKALSLAGIG